MQRRSRKNADRLEEDDEENGGQSSEMPRVKTGESPRKKAQKDDKDSSAMRDESGSDVGASAQEEELFGKEEDENEEDEEEELFGMEEGESNLESAAEETPSASYPTASSTVFKDSQQEYSEEQGVPRVAEKLLPRVERPFSTDKKVGASAPSCAALTKH